MRARDTGLGFRVHGGFQERDVARRDSDRVEEQRRPRRRAVVGVVVGVCRIHEEYSVSPSIRPIYTSFVLITTYMIQVCSDFH